MEKLATRGRPREFDPDQALASALRVFWTKGYEGASLTDLTEAMGITRPSLYAAFGNKEDLFKEALDLYEREKLSYVKTALEAPTARGVIERFIRGTIENVAGGTCRGCLGVIASVNSTDPDSAIRAAVLERAASSRAALRERIQRAIDEGDFPMPADADVIVRYMTTIVQGLAVEAGNGASAEQLQEVADAALIMWPSR